jgi:hypothetical protein
MYFVQIFPLLLFSHEGRFSLCYTNLGRSESRAITIILTVT